MTSKEMAVCASALGNGARLDVLRVLYESGAQGSIVGDIQKAVNLPGSTLSHHLERLRKAGLVTVRRQGTFLWYFPVPERVLEFTNSLLDLAAGRAAEGEAEIPPRPEAEQGVEIESD